MASEGVSREAYVKRRRARATLDELVLDILSGAGVSFEPPIDLPAVAYYLGCRTICEDFTGLHQGRTEVRGMDIVITLNAHNHRIRQRFILAHEIGHLVLAHPRYDLASVRRDAGVANVERFCNDFAARLLMPSAWVLALPQNLPVFNHLVYTAGHAHVSLSAALLRLRECARWPFAMLRWRRWLGRWDSAARVGVPYVLQPYLVTGAALQTQLDEVALHPPSTSDTVEMQLGVTPELNSVRVYANRRRETIIALADLRRARSITARRHNAAVRLH